MPEQCENCGHIFGKLETPYIWKEHVVCTACRKQLSEAEPDTAMENSAENMTELLKREPLTDEELAAEQKSHFSYGAQGVSQAPRKSKLVAGLLALFLGYLGIHNFYLGFTGKGIAQLFLTITVFGAAISVIWAFVEMMMIFAGDDPRDSDNRPLIG